MNAYTTTAGASSAYEASAVINPGLSQAADANLATGVLLLCKEALITAIQDRRLHRGHLRVLAAIAMHMSSRTAKAWPGRALIALDTGMPPKSVSNLLLELREFGYLIAEKEAVPEADNRRLTVYTFGNIDHDTIRRAITDAMMAIREGRIGRPDPSEKVPPQRDFQSPAPTGTVTLRIIYSPKRARPPPRPRASARVSQGLSFLKIGGLLQTRLHGQEQISWQPTVRSRLRLRSSTITTSAEARPCQTGPRLGEHGGSTDTTKYHVGRLRRLA